MYFLDRNRLGLREEVTSAGHEFLGRGPEWNIDTNNLDGYALFFDNNCFFYFYALHRTTPITCLVLSRARMREVLDSGLSIESYGWR